MTKSGWTGRICEVVIGDEADCSVDPCYEGHETWTEYDCLSNTCNGSDECEYACKDQPYGDIHPWSGTGVDHQCDAGERVLVGDGFTNANDVSCAMDAYNQTDPSVCPCCDVAPCTPDGFCNMQDVYAIFNAWNEDPACDVWCDCPSCGEQMRGGGGERPAETGELLVLFLTETAPVIEKNYIEIVEFLVDWLIEHMSSAQRNALADDLENPSHDFASRLAADMIENIVAALRAND